MTFEQALPITEYLLIFSVFLQSAENILLKRKLLNWLIQTAKLTVLLLLLKQSHAYFWFVLFVLQMLSLQQFRGNLNGGSDAMTTVTLFCVMLIRLDEVEDFLPDWQLAKFGYYYLCAQVALSYFIAGVVKIKQTDWRSGLALQQFLQQSFYQKQWPVKFLLQPQQQNLRRILSWFMMIWEICFPVIFLVPQLKIPYLLIGILFHAGNVLMFGLHRFFWAWVATYPLLLSFALRA